VVAVIEGFGINTDVGTDSDTGLCTDKWCCHEFFIHFLIQCLG
jgi:hypothetical protein